MESIVSVAVIFPSVDVSGTDGNIAGRRDCKNRNGILKQTVCFFFFQLLCGFGGQVEFRCLKFTGNPNTGKFNLSLQNLCAGPRQLTEWAGLDFLSFLEYVFHTPLQVDGVRYSKLSTEY